MSIESKTRQDILDKVENLFDRGWEKLRDRRLQKLSNEIEMMKEVGGETLLNSTLKRVEKLDDWGYNLNLGGTLLNLYNITYHGLASMYGLAGHRSLMWASAGLIMAGFMGQTELHFRLNDYKQLITEKLEENK
ncbi:MAG: hypothetical protein V1808_01500 [Candidatus Daviesbacteria bacterium]